jgi:hypothetical protein
VNLATNYFPCAVVEFPIRYLGIPLSITKLPKTACRYLIDSVADKLPAWKGSMMHISGRLTLIKSTLSAVPIHTAICLELSAWVRKALIKIMRGFLWTGTEAVQRPLPEGGLCIPDLEKMGMALRLTWLWKQHKAATASCSCTTGKIAPLWLSSDHHYVAKWGMGHPLCSG